jgi:hypothetical protein
LGPPAEDKHDTFPNRRAIEFAHCIFVRVHRSLRVISIWRPAWMTGYGRLRN